MKLTLKNAVALLTILIAVLASGNYMWNASALAESNELIQKSHIKASDERFKQHTALLNAIGKSLSAERVKSRMLACQARGEILEHCSIQEYDGG